MKTVPLVITLVTLFAIIYQIAPYIGFSYNAVLCMFLIAPFLVIFMVYVILKYGKPSGNTFDEKFYEDID